jgi:hypothetical protein
MQIFLPEFEYVNPWSFYHEVGNKSGMFDLTSYRYDINDVEGKRFLCGTPEMGEKNRYQHYLNLLHRRPGGHASISLEIKSVDDVHAVIDLFTQMATIVEEVRAGKYAPEEEIKISSKGTDFTYEMIVHTSAWTTGKYDDEGVFVKQGIRENEPTVYGLDVFFETEQRKVKVADYSFYSNTNSALVMARDLFIIKAMLEGVPKEEIRMLNPLTDYDPRLPQKLTEVINGLNALSEEIGSDVKVES